MGMGRRGFIIYLECQSVCPFIGTGSPNLSLASEYNFSLAGEGVGGGPNSDDWIKSLALCILCGMGIGPIPCQNACAQRSAKSQRLFDIFVKELIEWCRVQVCNRQSTHYR